MVHPIASAGYLRSIRRLGAMDEERGVICVAELEGITFKALSGNLTD
jgi:hypothetical protein